jgi:hypothetical protein
VAEAGRWLKLKRGKAGLDAAAARPRRHAGETCESLGAACEAAKEAPVVCTVLMSASQESRAARSLPFERCGSAPVRCLGSAAGVCRFRLKPCSGQRQANSERNTKPEARHARASAMPAAARRPFPRVTASPSTPPPAQSNTWLTQRPAHVRARAAAELRRADCERARTAAPIAGTQCSMHGARLCLAAWLAVL